MNLKKLDADFEIPEENWTREKTMGAGAYGKVMECIYKPLGQGNHSLLKGSKICFLIRREERDS